MRIDIQSTVDTTKKKCIENLQKRSWVKRLITENRRFCRDGGLGVGEIGTERTEGVEP